MDHILLKYVKSAPVVHYASAPVIHSAPVVHAVKHVAPATSYATFSQVHVSHPAPVVKYTSAPIVKYASAPIIKYASAPIVKYESAPIVKYESAPIVKYESAPIVKYSAPAVSYVSQPVVKVTNPKKTLININLTMIFSMPLLQLSRMAATRIATVMDGNLYFSAA